MYSKLYDHAQIPIRIYSNWLNGLKADKLTSLLLKDIKWDQPRLKVYGKNYLAPRLIAFIANTNVNYNYSGITHIGNGWPSWLRPLLTTVQDWCQTEFNGCLLNLYRNGNDCMGWHSDNEKEIDNTRCIASLSLGEKRDFVLRNRLSNEKLYFPLGKGDLLIMYPGCQANWMHSIPKRRKVKNLRINLTFRKYK